MPSLRPSQPIFSLVVALIPTSSGETPRDSAKTFFIAFTCGKIFGVCGSGDTFYDFYCKAIDDFEERFLKTGAKKGASSVKVDLAAEEEDIQNLEAFAKELVESLNG